MPYEKIGLKCGIEVHQQLEGKKLFCSCPTLIKDGPADFTIRRKLRAVAGESGEIDIAAQEEQLKGKMFVYQGYKDAACLVETDSEPPHELNKEALYTALQFCKLAQADISPVVQVMRKIVIDGSNTSGFQRTALIARNGRIDSIRISNISLEEDACKIIQDLPEEKHYGLDRLGIPLIEIGTMPDIKTPEQCRETAKKIGLLLRSLPGVKRGLGTIRQDVNVSITDGARIEIKGAQDLRQLALLVELEVKRQSELLKIKEELRGVRLNEIKIIELNALLQDCTSNIIKKTTESRGKILGIKLHGFSGFLNRELQPNHRLGTELSERAKAKAGVGGIFHSDELPNYGITEQEVKRIRKKLDCMPADAFVLVADSETKARLALEAVYERVKEVLKGIPKEVRKANADGTTSFMRFMPGSARMYPETDVPLIRPEIKNIQLPELLEDKIKRYQEKLNLSKDLAEFVAKSDKVMLFEELAGRHKKQKPAFIAETLTSTLLEIKRKYNEDSTALNESHFRELFKYLDEDKIHKDIVIDVLIDMIKKKFDIKKYETLSTEKIHKTIVEIVKANPNAPFSALMGLCMKSLAGKASGKVISEALKNILEKGHN